MEPSSQTTYDFILQHADGWQVYVFIGLIILLGWWSWSRYGPAPAGFQGVLARICRVLAIVCVICLLTGPARRSVTTSTIPGKLVVACDTSISMGREDGPDGTPRLAAVERIRRVLAAKAEQRPLEIGWYTVGGQVRQIPTDELATLEATGSSSPLAGHLETLANNTTVDMVMLLSDCRVTEGSALNTIVPRFRNRNLPIWILGTGSDQIDPELVLEEVIGPGEVATDEKQPYRLRIHGRNLSSEPIRVRLLIDGEVIDELELEAPATEDPVAPSRLKAILEAVIPDEGDATLTFQVEQGDLRSKVTQTVTASQRKLQVLLLAYAPRWEFRYLRDALDRDSTVTLHSYLAEGRWRRWGIDGPAEIPLTDALIKDYDCIILGDIPGERFNEQMLKAIDEGVRTHGSGLIWLPGEYGHTASVKRTEVGKLLPVDLPDQATIAQGYLGNRQIRLQRHESAVKLGLLGPGERAWSDLPALRGACPIDPEDGKKKHADILMTDEELNPVVVHARYGNGASILIAVDDTWRWRRYVGDIYLHRFWSQLIRYGSYGRGISDKDWRLQCSPYRSTPGEIVTLALTPSAPPEEGRLPDHVTVRLVPADHAGEPLPPQTLQRVPRDVSYSNRFPAPGIGAWNLEMVAGFPPDKVSNGDMVVLAPRREVSDPRIDIAAMEEVAKGTGGRHFVIDDFADIDAAVAKLPDLSDQHKESQIRPFWDNWIPLIIMVVLLGLEWSLRRGNRLP